MRDKLIPERRTDKNGRAVIRHVRAASSSTKSNHVFPPPVTEPKPASVDAKSIAKKQLAHIKGYFVELEVGFWTRRSLLNTLHRDTLTVLAEHGIGGDGDNIPYSLTRHCVVNRSFALLNDMAAYLEDHGATGNKDGYGNYDTCAYLIGLGGKAHNPHLATFGFSPYSTASPEERIAQHAVIEATRTLNAEHVVVVETDQDVPLWRLRSYALVEYIKANPDKVEALVKLINERGISPYENGLEDIESLMNTREEISTPLADGAL